jgi:succinate dehydrogenase / fumarate reductase cytochrome b subunit
MLGSILHRATGVALYVGALIVAAAAVCLAVGPECYTGFAAVMGSLPGEIVLFGLTLSLFYHLANGIRHLVWDAGAGLSPRTATMSLVFVLTLTLVASVAVWALAFATGGAR